MSSQHCMRQISISNKIKNKKNIICGYLIKPFNKISSYRKFESVFIFLIGFLGAFLDCWGDPKIISNENYF